MAAVGARRSSSRGVENVVSYQQLAAAAGVNGCAMARRRVIGGSLALGGASAASASYVISAS